MSDTQNRKYLPGPKVDERYGISSRTRTRWKNDPDLAFPRPVVINGREFYDEDKLEIWERSRATSTNRKAA